MFQKFQFNRELKRLQKERQRIRALYAPELEDKKTPDEIRQSLVGEMFQELDIVEEDIGELESNFLRREAERLMIPTPTFNMQRNLVPDGWVENTTRTGYRFSDETRADLRAAIGSQKREDREIFFKVASVFVALGSLAVAILALTIHSRPVSLDIYCNGKAPVSVVQH
jgi:hypothetical protein